MTDLELYHNKIRCPYCKDAFMQLDFVVPQTEGKGKVDLEIFMSCEKTIDQSCSGRMRINANAFKVETWETIKQG